MFFNDNNKDHIYTGKLAQQNEFAAINQGPVNLIPKIRNLQQNSSKVHFTIIKFKGNIKQGRHGRL